MSLSLVIGLILSALIGLSLGLIGGGGSIITVPVLVYVLGVDAHEAIPMSLAVVGSVSLVGAWMHRSAGNLALRTALLFGGSGIVGAFFGARLTYLVSSRILLLLFGMLMLVVASVMLFRKGGRTDATPHAVHPIKAGLAGLAVGVLTGFLGVGGGFLIVPALLVFGNLDVRKAIGTSLAVIFINCVAGIAGHLRQGGFDVVLAAMVTGPAILGAFAGTRLAGRFQPMTLRRVFALFVLGVAVLLIARQF